ncbi:MAG TPA: hypothetical protein VNO25_00185 [Streptosporangiaceae bacterium]|jgi:hypothetical protein|nr:hypothetical protein [Streptosporangiaceae bacterium]
MDASDISAIKPWAKLLMIIEAAVSLGIAGPAWQIWFGPPVRDS